MFRSWSEQNQRICGRKKNDSISKRLALLFVYILAKKTENWEVVLHFFFFFPRHSWNIGWKETVKEKCLIYQRLYATNQPWRKKALSALHRWCMEKTVQRTPWWFLQPGHEETKWWRNVASSCLSLQTTKWCKQRRVYNTWSPWMLLTSTLMKRGSTVTFQIHVQTWQTKSQCILWLLKANSWKQ